MMSVVHYMTVSSTAHGQSTFIAMELMYVFGFVSNLDNLHSGAGLGMYGTIIIYIYLFNMSVYIYICIYEWLCSKARLFQCHHSLNLYPHIFAQLRLQPVPTDAGGKAPLLL